LIVGLTPRQWSSIKDALAIHEEISKLEKQFGANLNLEADRFRLRREISELIGLIIQERSVTDLSEVFTKFRVSWSKYQTFEELLDNDPRASKSNPIFSLKGQEGIGDLPNIASPIRFTNAANLEAHSAPLLGANTEEILKELINLRDQDIQDLRDNKIIN